MQLSVIFPDKLIVLDGDAVTDPDLAPINPNHRVIQWDTETNTGVIEVYQGERAWITNPAVVAPHIERHAQLKAQQ